MDQPIQASPGSRPKSPPPPPPQVPPGQVRQVPRGVTIKQIIKDAHDRKASDIHIRVGQATRYRIRGEMVIVEALPKVTPEQFEGFLAEILTPAQRQKFAEEKELDTAIFYPGFLRGRINCFESLTGGAIVIRLISLDVPTIDDLGLPEVLKSIITRPQGLVLVTGPTGSGKSTTMAAMIRHLNETESRHIVTIEDPIEYVHASQNCLISQREVGLHTHEFHQALRAVLREDPDVILIGEMRDRITVNTALQAAQTGHLVLGTLHTRSAINSLNRLLNLYDTDEQQAMRIQITDSLVAVIAQLLLPTTDGRRTAAHEILVNTPAMQDFLLKGQEEEAKQLMEIDTIEGMQTLNSALYHLALTGRITIEEAKRVSSDPSDLDRLFRTGGFSAHTNARDFGV
ncbi:PilT/PilU family type 4a pilus ATPase [Desertifilum sp. FACHB-1129]|uniref:Type IV pili twitching motility protein PilT n=1 Tax=Desertifilum tharense IPPAS B-1220 TaxID=1781255 RepID=A0A1E5QKS9_9CYAN|nr:MULTISPECIES: PilT/PilU family type 4a pilus ATPase [Cyanophyceae]MCD8488539.1 PilT/PilU family type 4a pilus ATPase [Desertifilum sp.]MDA0211436.1 PilT/PilU family type 4a pilus ATPase [Cyanobacteria bacterium FC1]MDI9637808.1 PilT/PilU family type 4a pilus ATPase [Geitlerinema splendidum]MDL5051176.1 PilT/PilU family type 4a pilus ATPase [Oscillatoria amoena NRMC-F 0135]MBD2313517.1 PilT/PilU family type 4a pilus ATPase [Desertifilum sp. FACHB-1129]